MLGSEASYRQKVSPAPLYLTTPKVVLATELADTADMLADSADALVDVPHAAPPRNGGLWVWRMADCKVSMISSIDY